MKHLKNNKGLSLVELIVSFAILAIAGVAVMGLIQAGTNHFNTTGKDVGLQYEQQVVVNRLRDALLEASNAISYDDSTKTLLVYSQKDMGITMSGAVSHEYRFEMTKIFLSGDELRYASGLYTDLDPTNLDGVSDTLLGEDVNDVEFFLDEIDKGKIKFTITFESEGDIITSNQVVSLRNAVKEVTDSGEIILVSSETLYDNNILAVTIYRNGVAFMQNGSTNIDLEDGSSSVSVPFTYKVSAVETTRDYSAIWSLHADGSELGVAGVDVNPSTGVVTVDPSQAPDGTRAVLVCTSVDNPNKSQSIYLNIVSGGAYPDRLQVYTGTPVDYVGYRDYIVYPAIRYTDGTVKTEGDLCTWKISVSPDPVTGSTKLPVGCSFKLDELSHRYTLRATSQLNGRTITLTATVKAPKKDGTRLAPVQITIPIGENEIVDPNHPCDVLLSRPEDKLLKRGESTVVTASWNTNQTDENGNLLPVNYPLDYSMHWKIEKVGDDTWGKNGEKSEFDKTVDLVADNSTNSGSSTLTSEGDGWYRASAGVNTVKVDTETWLEWNKEYQIKISCYATDNKGHRYGLGDDVSGTYTGPVEEVLKYKPVRVLLTPVDSIAVKKNGRTVNEPLLTENKIKRAVKNRYKTDPITGKKTYEYPEDLTGFNKGRSIRVFEVAATGVKYDSTDRDAIKISKQSASEINKKTVFTFYNNRGYTVPKDEIPRGIQDFFAQYPEDGSNGLVGFAADMNSNLLIDYYTRFDNPETGVPKKNRPQYMSVLFRAYDDHGNISDTYMFSGSFNGSDEYNSSKMTSTRDYKFEIVFDYDHDKYYDINYVEIRQ